MLKIEKHFDFGQAWNVEFKIVKFLIFYKQGVFMPHTHMVCHLMVSRNSSYHFNEIILIM